MLPEYSELAGRQTEREREGREMRVWKIKREADTVRGEMRALKVIQKKKK